MMDNHKSEFLETVGAVSKFAGTLAGRLVVHSKEIADCVKNLVAAKLEPKPEPYTKAKKSIKNQAKKTNGGTAKKKTKVEQAKLKEKKEKSKSSSCSQGRVTPKASLGKNVGIETQKPKPLVTESKKSSVKSSRPTAKN